jgi:co-chaperonin GroES (HSP10)
MKSFKLIDIGQVTPFTPPKEKRFDNVLVKLLEHEKVERKTESGLIIPPTSGRDEEIYVCKGMVLKSINDVLEKETFVLFSSGEGTTFRLDGNDDEEFRIIPLDSISATLKESTQTK